MRNGAVLGKTASSPKPAGEFFKNSTDISKPLGPCKKKLRAEFGARGFKLQGDLEQSILGSSAENQPLNRVYNNSQERMQGHYT